MGTKRLSVGSASAEGCRDGRQQARTGGITATRIKAPYQEIAVIGPLSRLKDLRIPAPVLLSKENAALYDFYGATQQAVT